MRSNSGAPKAAGLDQILKSALKCKYLLASLLPDRDELLRLHGTVRKGDSIGPDAQGRHLRKEYPEIT